MSNPAGKKEVSFELEETIEKLESILSKIKTVSSPQDLPSIALVKRLVLTSEAIEKSVEKPQPVQSFTKRLSLVLVGVLLLAVVGVGIYWFNLSTTTQEVAEIPLLIDNNQPTTTITETIPQKEPIAETIPQKEPITETIPQEEPVLNTVLTPEQSFLAGVQKSITSLGNKLKVDLINSVEVDFNNSELKVKIDPAWYDLTPTQQDNLANDIGQRSQALAFGKIELVDSQEEVIARSPVVGRGMIILQRSH